MLKGLSKKEILNLTYAQFKSFHGNRDEEEDKKDLKGVQTTPEQITELKKQYKEKASPEEIARLKAERKRLLEHGRRQISTTNN